MARRSSFISTSAAPPPSSDFPLDVFPGGLCGYGFRKLSSTYTGDCLEVSPSTATSTFFDIGFDGNFIDRNALLAVGSDVIVREHFDQTGNDCVLRRGNASQRPTAVASNVINNFNGFEGVEFTEGDFYSQTGTAENPVYPCFYLVFAYDMDNVANNSVLLDWRYGSTSERVRIRYVDPSTYRVDITTLSAGVEETFELFFLPAGKVGMILSLEMKPTEYVLTINGDSRPVPYVSAGITNPRNNFFLAQVATATNSMTFLELLIYDGAQVGLADYLNNYYQFY